MSQNDERLQRIRSLSDKAGDVSGEPISIKYAANEDPTVVIPSKVPGPMKSALAAFGGVPAGDRRGVLYAIAVVCVIAILAGTGLIAYLISLGHVPSWLE